MEISVVTGDIVKIKVDALIVTYFENTKKPDAVLTALDRALAGAITQLIKDGDIKGKSGEITLIHSLGKLPAARVVVCGLGKPKDWDANKLRGMAGETCRWLRRKGISTVAVFPQAALINGITPERAAQAITEGAVLGLYTFRKYMTKKEDNSTEIKRIFIAGDTKNRASIEKSINMGKILAEATNLARDMANEPANYMTPTRMAETATALAERHKLEVTILEGDKMQELGMGGVLGVAQGSKQPPKFIILNYKGRDSKEIDLALVGKGITFDSGGLSLKPSEGMADMKGDKAGAAAVLAVMSTLAKLKVAMNVTALIPATENMPGGSAIKPGDVITAMNGKTIEVMNTDAEGRLILADALAYAGKLHARLIVDVATLTGACAVALGTICTGIFGNKQETVDAVIAAGKEAGEYIWQLPLFDEYRELIKSDVADIKNTGNRYGGAITAAKFLAEFVGDTPWAHLDIAGTNDTDKEKGYQVKGATGTPVRTLINFILARKID